MGRIQDRGFIGLLLSILIKFSHCRFVRLGGCPSMGCILPPDQADFLGGQYFDIRIEVHAPQNGSEAVGDDDLNEKFNLTIQPRGGQEFSAEQYFGVSEPELERWNFTYFEDQFKHDAGTPVLVNVVSKVYRQVSLSGPGEYTATLKYGLGKTTTASWLVRDVGSERRIKNVVIFIGDGMTTNMISAARVIGHHSINGRFRSRLTLDKFPVIGYTSPLIPKGHQMTHSMDSIITDSANSAASIIGGHKSSSGCVGVYHDSSDNALDDPKFETIFEMFWRLFKGGVGIVTTATVLDATPAATFAHTADRYEKMHIIEAFLNGITNTTWPTGKWNGPDVLMGGGGKYFQRTEANNSINYYDKFAQKGFQLVHNATQLSQVNPREKLLGIFHRLNLDTWLDRNVYRGNLVQKFSSPTHENEYATDQPGLTEMTVKAIHTLATRHNQTGWVLLSEAASIDKMMHNLDYTRALGEILELDYAVNATISTLKQMNLLRDTLVIVTADHGHGYDVMGTVDTEYLRAHSNDGQSNNGTIITSNQVPLNSTSERLKRNAIAVYGKAGSSDYTVKPNDPLSNITSTGFPMNWEPRYALYSGITSGPDRIEGYSVNPYGVRQASENLMILGQKDFYAKPNANISGILVNGTLPVDYSRGVHSLTDVPIYALGPSGCQELFAGTHNNIDIFFLIAHCLGLSSSSSSPLQNTDLRARLSGRNQRLADTQNGLEDDNLTIL